MSDPFRKVQLGDRLRIPAVAYNRLMDVARGHQADNQNAKRRQKFHLPPPGMILTVKNDRGADRGQFEVLGMNPRSSRRHGRRAAEAPGLFFVLTTIP